MQQTGNYQLSQWEKADRIQMEDFNGDNQKIDAALGALAAKDTSLEALISKCGNCKIWTTTYTGNDECSAAHPNRVTFPQRPLFVMIVGPQGSLIMAPGCGSGGIGCSYGDPGIPVNTYWNGTTVTWYSDAPRRQLNASGETYVVTAFLQTDA